MIQIAEEHLTRGNIDPVALLYYGLVWKTDCSVPNLATLLKQNNADSLLDL